MELLPIVQGFLLRGASNPLKIWAKSLSKRKPFGTRRAVRKLAADSIDLARAAIQPFDTRQKSGHLSLFALAAEVGPWHRFQTSL